MNKQNLKHEVGSLIIRNNIKNPNMLFEILLVLSRDIKDNYVCMVFNFKQDYSLNYCSILTVDKTWLDLIENFEETQKI